ncbi:ABC transporter permease [Actinosynnema sp. NPDC047251]|uniref:Transport permease protein n=1 Tax=Saccharothrix espanaensis (strain ATCC 51144 / DSM 44229 / JCM 9112 / NBRC 15066 / NRRL 15764) TaxID=1179773 RepID=K0JYF5_SACES|nr:ABC transporter permease [Saccharothrix espanaensis]CCH29739.1 ABC-2 type transporter [Saccharothrix espanaensis DSM 44229]
MLRDSVTFIGRGLRHSARSVDALLVAVILPVVILLLFVYVFGGAIAVGTQYVDYVVPGIILLCAGYGAGGTSVGVNSDMTTGVIDRFRSLPIAGSAVLVGHVVASKARNAVSTSLVLAVALLIGFRPTGGPLAWLGVAGVLLLFMVGVSWLAACFGLLARTPEAAGAFSFVVMFLPYLSSAFVPTDTMPAALRGVAEHQPVTPVIETLRGLMMSGPVGGSGVAAVLWCTAFTVVGGVGTALLFRRRTAP